MKRTLVVCFELLADDVETELGISDAKRLDIELAITQLGGTDIGYELTVEDE